MKKSLLKSICFIIVLFLILYCTREILAFKYPGGIYVLKKFYELEDNTVDVLILGSSRAYADVDTGWLWDKYGMAAFVLGGSEQPMWNTYYYLKEALKTQTPQLIVLEAYRTTLEDDYATDVCIIRNTYGMKWTKDRMDAIKVSAPKTRWGEFLLAYTQYHARYADLDKEDFCNDLGDAFYDNWKGSAPYIGAASFDNPDIKGITDRRDLSEKTEKYYRRIIELARSNDIPILIMVSPYAEITKEAAEIYNSAADIAEEYNVEFINYNLQYKDIGIDFSCDAADSSHLNYKGSQKFTQKLGTDIVQNYEVSDRRRDDRYKSWEANARYLSSFIENQRLAESEDLISITENLKNQKYLLFISLDGNCDVSSDNIKFFLGELGITRDINQLYCIDNKNGILYTNEAEEETKYFRLDTHDVCLSRKMDAATQVFLNSIVIDNVAYTKVKNGISVVVYNPATKSVVDSFGLDMNIGYNFTRL